MGVRGGLLRDGGQQRHTNQREEEWKHQLLIFLEIVCPDSDSGVVNGALGVSNLLR